MTVLISLQIAFFATTIVAVLGLPLAAWLARPVSRHSRIVDVIVMLPLAFPPSVLGYYLLLLFGRGGLIGTLTTSLWGSTLLFTRIAAVIAACVVSFPLFVQAARNALIAVEPEVYEAAQIDGAGRGALFRYIALPLARSGIVTGMILVFARSLGEFGATLMVAGNIPGHTQTLSLAIYSAIQAGDGRTAQMLAVILTSIGTLALWTGLRVRQGQHQGRAVPR